MPHFAYLRYTSQLQAQDVWIWRQLTEPAGLAATETRPKGRSYDPVVWLGILPATEAEPQPENAGWQPPAHTTWVQLPNLRHVQSRDNVRLLRIAELNGVLEVRDEDFMQLYQGLLPSSHKSIAERRRNLLTWIGGAMLALLVVIYGGGKLISTIAYHLWSQELEDQLSEQMMEQVKEQSSIDKEKTKALKLLIAELDMGHDKKFDAVVVNDEVVNAFTLPGDHIIICEGIINRMATKEEFIALLGHEFGHVKHSHIRQSMSENVASAVITTSLGRWVSRANSTLGGLMSLKHSRDAELQADVASVDLLHHNGLNTLGSLQLMSMLSDEGGPGIELLSTHPDPLSRIREMQAYIAQLPAYVPDTNTAAREARLEKLWKKLND